MQIHRAELLKMIFAHVPQITEQRNLFSNDERRNLESHNSLQNIELQHGASAQSVKIKIRNLGVTHRGLAFN